MAKTDRPGNNLNGDQHPNEDAASRDESLEQRRRILGAELATRRKAKQKLADGAKARENTGYGQAMRLSSEFIAGIVVGTVIGWIIDRVAGTSPWGLIIFLLLGFVAGVLNVLRSAGMVAEGGIRKPDSDRSGKDRE